MTRIATPALLFTVVATPALAHSGMHLHPHGGAQWLAVAAGLSAICLAAGLALSRVGARR